MRLKIQSLIIFSCITLISCENSENAITPKDYVSYYSFDGNTNDVKSNLSAITNFNAKLVSDKNGKANSAYSFDGNSYILSNG